METALYEAPDDLADLLDEGRQITITRHGQVAAKLVPVEPLFDRAKAKEAAERLLELRKGATLGGLSIKELINEGRR